MIITFLVVFIWWFEENYVSLHHKEETIKNYKVWLL